MARSSWDSTPTRLIRRFKVSLRPGARGGRAAMYCRSPCVLLDAAARKTYTLSGRCSKRKPFGRPPLLDDVSKPLIGNGRGVKVEILTPWSRTWGQGADFVAIQSFEWCFNASTVLVLLN